MLEPSRLPGPRSANPGKFRLSGQSRQTNCRTRNFPAKCWCHCIYRCAQCFSCGASSWKIARNKQDADPGERDRKGGSWMTGRSRLTIAVAAVGMLISAAAGAQEYPTKPITLIVPWPAGGSTDISMRAIAESASKVLGQPIVIDNKGGGGGTVGPATMAAAAKPDGYTLSQIPITVFRLPLMQDVSWDPSKDFTYIVHLTGYTFGVTTSAESQFK